MKNEIEENKILSELEEKTETSFWRRPKFPIHFIFGLGLLIVLIVAVRLLIGIQHNNFVVQTEIAEGEQKQIETSDWITYTNERFCFEVEYPREWEIGVEIDDAYLNDLSVVFSKDNDFEKLGFRLSINQYSDLGVVPTQYRYEGQEIAIAGIDFTPGINSSNSRHRVFGDFCVDENLNEISPIFPACEQDSGNFYFQFSLSCEGTGWEGGEGRGRCSDLFNQILATFEFTCSLTTAHTEISRQPDHQQDCPRLSSELFQLTQADDPLTFAEERRLKVKNNKVQVVIELVSEEEERDFLEKFQAEIETQYKSLVQAFVPLDQLCELAKMDAVLAIRRPREPQPGEVEPNQR